MSRIMTIWLPRWPVQRRLVERPERRHVPLLVCRTEPRGVRRVVGWAWATARIKPPRIPCGQTLAETLAALALTCGSQVCRMAEVDHDDPDTDRVVLEGIARWCRRFSPTTALEDALRPECIHVDLTGTAELLGGEQTVVRTAVWTLASRGLHARAAVADTPGAAWAAAHYLSQFSSLPAGSSSGRSSFGRAARERGRRWAVVSPGRQGELLATLPAAALRIGEDAVAALSELGVETIGQLRQLPRKSLASRLGPEVVRRVKEFEGSQAEPLVSVADDAFPHAECHLSAPASTLEAIRCVLEPLVEQCMAAVVSKGFGVTVLQVRLSEGRVAESLPTVIDVGLFRPATSSRHVVDLVQLRLARMRLPREIESLAVEVVSAGPVTCRQRVLFEGVAASAGRDGDQTAQLGMLLDRLASRLGRMAVFEPRAVADAQPEHAWAAAPPVAGNSRSLRASAVGTTAAVQAPAKQPFATGARRRSRSGGRSRSGEASGVVQLSRPLRPVWMTPRPIRVETVSVVPDGPPVWFCISGVRHRVTDAWGPERIETAWWRGCSVRRDYYVVETESGARWWLFRRLSPSPGHRVSPASEREGEAGRGAWFLHGQFA